MHYSRQFNPPPTEVDSGFCVRWGQILHGSQPYYLSKLSKTHEIEKTNSSDECGLLYGVREGGRGLL